MERTEIEVALNAAIERLEGLRPLAEKISSGERGSKAANTKLRKTLQGIRSDLTDLRGKSLDLHRSGQ